MTHSSPPIRAKSFPQYGSISRNFDLAGPSHVLFGTEDAESCLSERSEHLDTMPSYHAFQLQYILASISTLLFVFTLSFVTLFVTRFQAKYTFLQGVIAYFAADAIHSKLTAIAWLHFENQMWISKVVPSLLQAVLQESLRVIAVLISMDPVPQIRDLDDSRLRLTVDAYCLALGFALAECTFRSFAFMNHTTLYKTILTTSPVIPPNDETNFTDGLPNNNDLQHLEVDADIKSFLRTGSSMEHELLSTTEEDKQDSINELFQEWSKNQEREILEEALGQPLFEMPSILLFFWSLDSTLLSVALTLLLTAQPRLSISAAFILTTCIHVFQSVIWTLLVPKKGLSVLSYAGLLFNTGLLLASLALHGIIR